MTPVVLSSAFSVRMSSTQKNSWAEFENAGASADLNRVINTANALWVIFVQYYYTRLYTMCLKTKKLKNKNATVERTAKSAAIRGRNPLHSCDYRNITKYSLENSGVGPIFCTKGRSHVKGTRQLQCTVLYCTYKNPFTTTAKKYFDFSLNCISDSSYLTKK